MEKSKKDKKVYAVKVLIKSHYDNKGDLVSKPFVRAFNKINSQGIKKFITEEGVILYCTLENDKLYDVFTQKLIEVDNFNYEVIPSSILVDVVKSLSKEEIHMVDALIKKFILGESIDIDFVEVSTMEELSKDRAELFADYELGLTTINPYERYHENDYNKSLNERLVLEKTNDMSRNLGKRRG